MEFIHRNASFVSQVVLLTYIKARAGTKSKLFENREYLKSIEMARSNIYAACVADLIFYVINEHCLTDIKTKKIHFIQPKLVDEVFTFAKYDDKVVDEFNKMKKRCKEQINELNIEKTDHKLFRMRSDTLFKWAPMAEEFKKDDEEIMRNSILFKWIEVRRELRSRIKPSQIFS